MESPAVQKVDETTPRHRGGSHGRDGSGKSDGRVTVQLGEANGVIETSSVVMPRSKEMAVPPEAAADRAELRLLLPNCSAHCTLRSIGGRMLGHHGIALLGIVVAFTAE